MAGQLVGALTGIWRSVCCALCHRAITMSRLFTNDTLHFVSTGIASECLVQRPLKVIKASLSISVSSHSWNHGGPLDNSTTLPKH